MKHIKKISFLFNDERIILSCNAAGKFKLPSVENDDGVLRTVNKFFYPRQVLEHNLVKRLDPFITMSNGDKMRVYQGGDPSYMLAEVQSVLDNHLQKYEKLLEKLKKPTPKKKTYPKIQTSFTWEDYEDIF